MWMNAYRNLVTIIDIVQIQMAALPVHAILDMLEMGSPVLVKFCVQNAYSEDCFTL